jgi:hypothetical protein
MSHRNVEILIGRLATDPLLRRRFTLGPPALLRELQAEGCELSAVEIDALARLDGEALRAFAATLDRRLCKAASVTRSSASKQSRSNG